MGPERGMPQRELILPIALLCVIALFTAFATSATPRPPMIGAFAQYLLPAILTIYLLVVLAYSKIIVELLAAFFLGNRKQDGSSGRSFAVILGYAIGFVLFFVFLRIVMFQSIAGVFQTAANLVGTWFHPTQSQTVAQPSGASANPFLFYYTHNLRNDRSGGTSLVFRWYSQGVRMGAGRVRAVQCRGGEARSFGSGTEDCYRSQAKRRLPRSDIEMLQANVPSTV